LDALLQDQHKLEFEVIEVKSALAKEKELNAKRHEDILAALTTELSPPAP